MVYDDLRNAGRYAGLGGTIWQGLQFLTVQNLNNSEPGRYDLANGMYVVVQCYTTRPQEECAFETHREYVDIQYMVDGYETIGCAMADRGTFGEYDNAADCAVWKGQGEQLGLFKGMFCIFFPGEPHMPGIGESPQSVKKIIVKIPINK